MTNLRIFGATSLLFWNPLEFIILLFNQWLQMFKMTFSRKKSDKSLPVKVITFDSELEFKLEVNLKCLYLQVIGA